MGAAPRHRAPDGDGLMPIGRVVELVRRDHPSVTASSLRFLEREGLIRPTRTPGGHRLYSESDIQRIVQIKEWQAQRLSLEQIHRRLDERDRLPDAAALTQAFLQMHLEGDIEAAGRTILAADDLGMPLPQIFAEVLEPALIEIGRGWERGTVLVAQEKTVSELVRDLIAELSFRHAAPDPQGPTVLAACVAGERHELGLRMIAGLLRSEGFRVHFLGADVDTVFLLDAVRLHTPSAVLLSAPLGVTTAPLEEAIAALVKQRGANDLPRIVVGGRLAMREPQRITAQGAIPIDGGGLSLVTDRLMTLLRSEPEEGR